MTLSLLDWSIIIGYFVLSYSLVYGLQNSVLENPFSLLENIPGGF